MEFCWDCESRIDSNKQNVIETKNFIVDFFPHFSGLFARELEVYIIVEFNTNKFKNETKRSSSQVGNIYERFKWRVELPREDDLWGGGWNANIDSS